MKFKSFMKFVNEARAADFKKDDHVKWDGKQAVITRRTGNHVDLNYGDKQHIKGIHISDISMNESETKELTEDVKTLVSQVKRELGTHNSPSNIEDWMGRPMTDEEYNALVKAGLSAKRYTYSFKK